MTIQAPSARCFASLTLVVVGCFGVAIAVPYRVGLQAQTVPAKPLVGLFEARYRSATTLQATFLERYTENGQTVRTEAGTAYFRRPGKMRWDYEAPERDLFL